MLAATSSVAVLALAGCNSSGQRSVAPPSVDAQACAVEAMKLYDANGDGKLSETEAAACPAIKSALVQYDRDRDGQISQDEITERFRQLYSVSVGLINVPCIVTLRGRPLADAEVRFVPETFLGDSTPVAVAKTGPNGTAYPSIPADSLPSEFQSVPMMYVGVYRVEIRHPTLSAVSKPLGWEVDPTSRNGAAARFDL